MSEPVYARADDVIWRLAPRSVLVHRVWPVDGLDTAAELNGPAAVAWIVLDEPGTQQELETRAVDDGPADDRPDLTDAIRSLRDAAWITATD